MNILDESAEYLIPLSWSSYPFEISPGAQERFDFYQASIYPTAYFWGTHLIESWDCSITTFNAAYENLVTLESPFNIDLEFEQLREESFEIIAEVTVTENIISSNNKVFFVITNWVEYSVENPWFYLVVAKSDEENVTLSNIGETAIYTAALDVEMQPDWNLEDLYAVAIVQDWDSHEILQAAQVNLIPTSVNDPIVPAEISLYQNYPNPFNPSTTISFDVAHASSFVNLEIFNMKGQKVKQLVKDQLSVGQHQVIWNGTDDSGSPVSSGIYFYKLKSGVYTSTKKMILMK
ncbi:MAG: T9SS type A sorting domain-containing protein [Candidatus Cloacimonetes bacterium]|nr:T9SS type A sorting domain-containing protein [Candidatus Cloacimonadota bacterium]